MGLPDTRAFAWFARGAAVGLLAAAVALAAEPLVVGEVRRETPDGPVRGLWARVALDHPAVRVGVTEPVVPTTDDPPGTEARLLPVDAWARANGAALAINASFFGLADPPPAPGEPRPRYLAGAPADIRGLSRSATAVVSPPRVVAGRGDPALLVFSGRARVAYATTADLDGVVCAVAGIGPTPNSREPGTLLVEAGRNTGATARVGPRLRHPRTAAGVTADGRTLILLVVDGRQPGHSVGATLPELADLLIELGVHDAVALDGGGSSSFHYRRPDGSLLTNRPSDGRWRPVANHLGVWIEAPAVRP